MAVLLTDPELDALDGLPHMDVVAYITLRRRMDFSTGVVGQSARVSRQALVEALEVPARQGRAGEQVSHKAVTCSLERLAAVGLVKPMPVDKADRRLVFLLCHAPTAEARAKKVGQIYGRPTRQDVGQNHGRGNANNGAGFDGFADEVGQDVGQTQNGEVGQTSYGLCTPHSLPYVNQSTVESVAGVGSTDGFAGEQENRAGQGQSQKRSAGGVAAPAIAVVKALADHAGMRVSAMNPAVLAIAELEPSPEQLAEALGKCKAIRADERSNAPINLNFIRSNLIAVQKAGRVRAPSDWRTNTTSAQRYARALGVPCPDGRAGESMPEFVARIAAFARDAEERAQA